jgi:hypothetical protein
MPEDLPQGGWVVGIERHVAEWMTAQRGVPGAEVHDDPDITCWYRSFPRFS